MISTSLSAGNLGFFFRLRMREKKRKVSLYSLLLIIQGILILAHLDLQLGKKGTRLGIPLIK